VRQDAGAIGAWAVRTLLGLIADGEPASPQGDAVEERVPVRLVVRDSTGPAPLS